MAEEPGPSRRLHRRLLIRSSRTACHLEWAVKKIQFIAPTMRRCTPTAPVTLPITPASAFLAPSASTACSASQHTPSFHAGSYVCPVPIGPSHSLALSLFLSLPLLVSDSPATSHCHTHTHTVTLTHVSHSPSQLLARGSALSSSAAGSSCALLTCARAACCGRVPGPRRLAARSPAPLAAC